MPDETWTIGRLIEWTRGFFERKGIEQPRLEAEILLAHVLGVDRVKLYTGYDREVDGAVRERYREMVRRRSEGEPTRQLVGRVEFMSLEMKVTPEVLIPRPETELIVEQVLRLSGVSRAVAATPETAAESEREPASAIELCTGSGCVAVSAAVYLPQLAVTATDTSEAALAVARQNAETHGVAERITFLQGDLYDALDAADAQPADFLLANPPYVAEGEWGDLAPEVRDHEPRQALVAGPDGTEVIERVLKGAPAYLVSGGTLLVEIGATQGLTVREMAEGVRALEDVTIQQDYSDLDRLLVARRT